MKKLKCFFLAGLIACLCAGCQAKGAPDAGQEAAAGTEAAVSTEAANGIQAAKGTESETDTEEASAQEELGIKDVFGAHQVKAGTCISEYMISDPKMSEVILKNFNSVTTENAMKPENILSKTKSAEAGEVVVQFPGDALAMLKWAKENNMSMRGHTLVWYSQTPAWLFHKNFDQSDELVDREELLKRMEDMIRKVFEELENLGYADLFYAYDVVNEAWMEDGSMRDCEWSEIIGEDYLWYAFSYARKYAPEHIDLYYNDYNEQFKADTILKFVDTLKDEDGNSLIDGIGLQGHLYTNDDLPRYFEAVDKLAGSGLKLEVTELDVSLGAWQNTLEATEENLLVQGKFYYDLIKGLFERVDDGRINMDALTFWGFRDDLSWRRDASPLLYDALMQPKLAYYGALQQEERLH